MVAIEGRLASLRWRRAAAVALTITVGIVAWAALDAVRRSLGDVAVASGWTLLASTLGLYGLAARKRSHRSALGPVAAWLQVHTYLGCFALLMFFCHVRWPIRGAFEFALAAMFLFISLSGIVLIYLSRRIPKQLAAVKVDYRLEDIPAVQADWATEAHSVALRSSGTGSGATLAEFYQRRLLAFFHSRRSFGYRCMPTGSTRRQLLRELEDLDRYLDAGGKELRQRLAELVVAKDDTDFHQALQLRLRWWVIGHVALTWSVLLMIAVHVVLVLRFQGTLI